MREGRTRSAVKLTRHAKDQLIDDAANLLANMVKTRQTVQDLPPSIRQVRAFVKNTYLERISQSFSLR